MMLGNWTQNLAAISCTCNHGRCLLVGMVNGGCYFVNTLISGDGTQGRARMKVIKVESKHAAPAELIHQQGLALFKHIWVNKSDCQAWKSCNALKRLKCIYFNRPSLGEPQFIRYDPWGRMYVGSIPCKEHCTRNLSAAEGSRGGLFHDRWEPKNRAKLLPPISIQASTAFHIPPETRREQDKIILT